MVGLNFANEQEAEKFGNAVETKINERVEKKRAGSRPHTHTLPLSLSHTHTHTHTHSLTLSAALKATGGGGGGGGAVGVEVIGRPQVAPISDKNDPFAANAKKGKPKRPKGKKINKADIGLPSDFRYLYSVQCDNAYVYCTEISIWCTYVAIL